MTAESWKIKALSLLPEAAEAIAEAENPMQLWIEIRLRFADAYKSIPPNEDLISRVYAFADWCVQAPRGTSAEDDLPTCVHVAFYEHIPEIPQAAAELSKWFSREEMIKLKETFSYHIGDEAFQRLLAAAKMEK